jgi:hypothetical protein
MCGCRIVVPINGNRNCDSSDVVAGFYLLTVVFVRRPEQIAHSAFKGNAAPRLQGSSTLREQRRPPQESASHTEPTHDRGNHPSSLPSNSRFTLVPPSSHPPTLNASLENRQQPDWHGGRWRAHPNQHACVHLHSLPGLPHICGSTDDGKPHRPQPTAYASGGPNVNPYRLDWH